MISRASLRAHAVRIVPLTLMAAAIALEATAWAGKLAAVDVTPAGFVHLRLILLMLALMTYLAPIGSGVARLTAGELPGPVREALRLGYRLRQHHETTRPTPPVDAGF